MVKKKRLTKARRHPNDVLLDEAVTLLARLNVLEGDWEDAQGVTLAPSGRLAQRIRERTATLDAYDPRRDEFDAL